MVRIKIAPEDIQNGDFVTLTGIKGVGVVDIDLFPIVLGEFPDIKGLVFVPRNEIGTNFYRMVDSSLYTEV